MTQVFHPAQYAQIHFDDSLTTAQSLDFQAEINDFKVCQFSGVSLGKLGLKSGDFSSRPIDFGAVYDLADASGEWMAIARKEFGEKQAFVVFGDASGFCPVFYTTSLRGSIIVSDSFHGVVRGLTDAGKHVSLNVSHYVASLTAHHAHFDNPSVQKTMANEIEILRRSDALLVTDEGVRVISRNYLGKAWKVDNYEDALSLGIESIRSSLEAISQDENLVKTINFSGGVDSRMAMAFVTEAGFNKDFLINSLDPRTWSNPHTKDTIERDIAIANLIRENLGMSWAPKADTALLQYDFQDSLAFHQGFRSNFSYNFRPVFGHSVVEDSHITIRGGGGELLRVTATGAKIAAQISTLYGESEAASSNSELIKKWYLRRSPTEGATREVVSSYFSQMDGHFDGESLEESLNSYYQNTRNRTHFGHLRQSSTTNNTSIHLLANSFFMRAGALLPFEVKKSGKLVKDIFLSTDPSLLNYQFESDVSTQELSTPQHLRVGADDNSWQNTYDKVAKTKRKTTPVSEWSADARGVVSPYNKTAASEAYLLRAFRVVEDLCGADEVDIIRSVHQGTRGKAAKNQLQLFSLVAKVASAVDLKFPIISHGNVVHFNCGSSSQNIQIQSVSIANRPVPRDGWNDRPVVELVPELRVVGNKFVARVELNVPAPHGMKFAFQLYRGNKRVAQSWYTETTRRTFDIDLDPGKYTVRTYVRSSGDLTPSYSIQSPPVVIPQ